MNLDDIGIKGLGERVEALHGEDVFQAALQRALAIATRRSVRLAGDSRNVFPDAPADAE